MTFSAGRRVASPFAQRAAQHAQTTVDTPDISDVSTPEEPKEDVIVADAPEILEEHPEAVGESNNQEVANDASGEAQELTSETETAEILTNATGGLVEPSIDPEDVQIERGEAVIPLTESENKEPTTAPAKGRGRPRPTEVKERDDKILAEIAGHEGNTRAALEEALGMTQNEVYMSLFRLRTEGKIEKRRIDGKHCWFVTTTDADADCA